MDIEALRGSLIGQLVPIEGYDPRFREDYECRRRLKTRP